MPEKNSIRFYYVVFWIRFRSARLSAAQRGRLLGRFGFIAGRHGAVALAADGSADRLCALLGIHPRRDPDTAIRGIREDLSCRVGGSAGGPDLEWEEDYAAIPLSPEEVATLLDISSSPGFAATEDVPEDGWWEEDLHRGSHPWALVPPESEQIVGSGEEITS